MYTEQITKDNSGMSFCVDQCFLRDVIERVLGVVAPPPIKQPCDIFENINALKKILVNWG